MTEKNRELFLASFPDADLSRFYIYEKGVSLKLGGMSYDVFISKVGAKRHHYFGKTESALKQALGVRVKPTEAVHPKVVDHENDGSFPKQLTFNPSVKYPIPGAPFDQNILPDIGPILSILEIFVSPKESFTIKVRDVFTETTLRHVSGPESMSWLRGPSIKYWPQQLNFAVWLALSGCGISYSMLLDDDSIR